VAVLARIGTVGAFQSHLTGRGQQETRKHSEERRLARAVGAPARMADSFSATNRMSESGSASAEATGSAREAPI
jgi:hypothetical protein